MTQNALEKKYNVQIDQERTAWKSKKVGWIAYDNESEKEICKGKTIADIEKQLKEIYKT